MINQYIGVASHLLSSLQKKDQRAGAKRKVHKYQICDMFQIIGSHSGHQVCISLFGGPRAASTSKNRTLFSALGRSSLQTLSPDSLGVLCQHPGNAATGRFFHGGILQLVKTSFFSANEFSLSKKTPLGLRLWLNDLGPKKPNHHYKTPKPFGGRRRGAKL